MHLSVDTHRRILAVVVVVQMLNVVVDILDAVDELWVRGFATAASQFVQDLTQPLAFPLFDEGTMTVDVVVYH